MNLKHFYMLFAFTMWIIMFFLGLAGIITALSIGICGLIFLIVVGYCGVGCSQKTSKEKHG